MLVQAELLLGGVLLAGLWPRFAVPAAAVLFSVFAAASVVSWSAGRADCGCLGTAVSVDPAWMAAFDLAAAGCFAGLWVSGAASAATRGTDVRLLAFAVLAVVSTTFTASRVAAGAGTVERTPRVAAGGDAAVPAVEFVDPAAWTGGRPEVLRRIMFENPSIDLEPVTDLSRADASVCVMSTPRRSYPSDVTDAGWEFLLPYLVLMRGNGLLHDR